jgi:pimeloyl-ACP methyl ester carboxylesterase
MNRKIINIEIAGYTMEFSVIGKGEPILIFHGGHSNCKEELGYQALLDAGYSVITPSRAGYGSTSKEIGETLTTACMFYAKILDYLEISKVHIIAISAGGPTGIRFAALFPDRIKSLTLECAVTKEWLTKKDMAYKAARIIFRPSTERFTWLMVRVVSSLFPKCLFRMMSSQFSTLPKKDWKQSITGKDIKAFQNMLSHQRSGYGFLIDIQQAKEITTHDLQTITCPTLILHSKYDASVSIEHPKYAHTYMSKSELCLLDSWGHLIWIGKHAEVRDKKLLSFLQNIN